MTHNTFSQLLKRRLNLTKQILDTKSKEYASGVDKLHNFVLAARMNGNHPSQAAHGMLTKHLISYLDMVDNLSKGVKFTQDYIDEKFGDIINYFILQEAIFTEYGIRD